ncbi:hypothetical protein [Paenibacillus sp. CH40]|uniref:hypothetical protein n=1 Tax=Paenibacillus sp. CH40 TaxID=2962045 RepID=UPI00349F655C
MHNTFPHTPDPDYGTNSVLLGFDDESKRQRVIELLVQSVEYGIIMGKSGNCASRTPDGEWTGLVTKFIMPLAILR